jgi:hypothetical protein
MEEAPLDVGPVTTTQAGAIVRPLRDFKLE